MMRWSVAVAAGLTICGIGCAGPDPSPAAREVVEEDEAASCPEPVADQAAVTATYLEVLYPDAGEDLPIACKYTSADCSVKFTHSSTPPAGAPPTIAACRSGAQPLGTCYGSAVQVTLVALNTGDASLLYEAAVRTRDVVLRASVDNSSPPWLRTFGAANLLARTFISRDIRIDSPLPACGGGTMDQRYACLANADRKIFRGLLALLDHHLGVLARTSKVPDLSERAWNIVESATAPVHAQMIGTGRITPSTSTRMNRIDLLGKYVVLRLLDGTAAEGDDTELAELVTRATYVPAASGAVEPMFVPRFDVMLAGGAVEWDTKQHRPIDRDAVGATDLRALWRTMTHGITLASLQGRCALSQEIQDVRFALAGMFTAKQLRAIPLEGIALETLTTLDSSWHQLLTSMDIAQGRACGWITSEDYVEAYGEVSYWYEYDAWEDCDEGSITNDGAVVTDCEPCEVGEEINGIECECDLHTYCVRHNIFGACTEEYSFYDCGYIVELEYSQTEAPARIADAYTFVQSLRKAYRDLMSYYDAFSKVGGEWVLGSGDNVYDLHYNPLAENNATIALSYVDGEQCMAELESLEDAFGNTQALTCAPGDICDSNHSALWPPGSWIPFPIATRLCPETAGKFDGVLADDGSDSWCRTPWQFTKAVAHDWLPNSEAVITAIAEEDAKDGIVYGNGTWQAEDGETLTSTLVEFFAETNLLSQPIATMYLRKAQLASAAGYLPTLAANQALVSDTFGLDTIEANVDTGLSVMARDFELMLDFHELEDDVTSSAPPIALYYDRPIPRMSLAAMDEVHASTVTNDYTSNRAMIYPRLGDALELHRELVRMKLDVLWRRADGFGACLDTGTCDTTAPGCAEYCGYYNDAVAFTESASAELDPIDDMLASHGSWLARQVCPFKAVARTAVGSPQICNYDDPADLGGYIARLRDHIVGTQDELARARESLQAGNDVFGFRGMNHYPGEDISGRIEDLVAVVRDMGREYEGFIDDYLATLSDYSDFEASVSAASSNSSAMLANYCVDELGVAQPEGCAIDKTTWTSTQPLVAEINQLLLETICSGQLVDRDTGESLAISVDQLDENGYTELAGLVQDYVASLGLTTADCPTIAAPDFAQWEGYGGVLATDLSSMELLLEQLAAQLARLKAELYAQETMSEAIEVIQNGTDATTNQGAAAHSVLAGITCVFAVGVAIASDGVGILPAVSACSEFVESLFDADTADSLEELHLELDTLLAGYSNLQNLMAIIFDVYNTLLQYDAAVRSFDAHRAQFLNVQANIESDFRSLYTNAFAFDPTNLLFGDEQVASMALRFNSAMSDVRELEILVGYDLGEPIAENRAIFIENGYYYLPRLTDITVAEDYGLGGDDAYVTLQGSSRPLDERDVTLVAVATLLGAIHDAAQTLSGNEQTTHGFLSEPNASGFDANGYPQSFTEWSLLRRSPFYNAWIASDPSADENGDGLGEKCGTGAVDLYYYCKQADGTPAVPENTCLAVTTLDEKTRLNLAWADHQIVGIHAVAFTCTPTPTGYTIAPARGPIFPYLSMEELNPTETRDDAFDFDWYLPDFMEDGTIGVGDTWYNSYVSTAFYNSQTPTVRALMDAIFDMADYGAVTVTTRTFMPGSYLLGMHSSDSENPNTVYDPVVNDFDLEGWGLTGSTSAGETFAERLKDISVLCTDADTCPGMDRLGSSSVESHYARFFYGGPAYQSTICSGPVNQEKTEWMIDDRMRQGSFAIRSTISNSHLSDAEWMSSRASDPNASVKAGSLAEVPLQPTLSVIQVFGLTDGDGAILSNQWVLHGDPGADEIPNLRVALHYRYYGTQLTTNAQWSLSDAHSFYESVTTCTSPTSTYPWQ